MDKYIATIIVIMLALGLILGVVIVNAQEVDEPEPLEPCFTIELERPGNVHTNVIYGRYGGYVLDQCTGNLWRIDRDRNGVTSEFISLEISQ